MTTDLVFYFEAHQPYRLVKSLPKNDKLRRDPSQWFDDEANAWILRRVADRCYRPMSQLLLEMVERLDGEFSCSLSLSGTLIQQLKDWSPETVKAFTDLADTGHVEFLCETSHHSISGLVQDGPDALEEFRAQVADQKKTVTDLFGEAPVTFRNTELIVDETIAKTVEELGFDLLLGEGASLLLGWRPPHHLYRPHGCERLKLLLRDYDFSDDIGFRFSDRTWERYPLFAEAYAEKLKELPESAQVVGLFMDYETFGEHQWASTGIFEFFKALPRCILDDDRFRFRTPRQVAEDHDAVSEIRFPRAVSWADQERDVSAWLGNPMQQTAHHGIHGLRPKAIAAKPALSDAWRKLTTSDHTYYMATKRSSDGDVHEYFSPYASPHDAFMIFMDVCDALARELDDSTPPRPAPQKPHRKSRK
ncbi:MAG: glycoside hydrolase family 57 protein [Planctomycetota bacterium]